MQGVNNEPATFHLAKYEISSFMLMQPYAMNMRRLLTRQRHYLLSWPPDARSFPGKVRVPKFSSKCICQCLGTASGEKGDCRCKQVHGCWAQDAAHATFAFNQLYLLPAYVIDGSAMLHALISAFSIANRAGAKIVPRQDRPGLFITKQCDMRSLIQ